MNPLRCLHCMGCARWTGTRYYCGKCRVFLDAVGKAIGSKA